MPKPEQKSITAFLNVQEKREKECVTLIDNGLKRLCDICGRSFYAQGWIQHRRTHPEVEKLYRKPTAGKVKVRGDFYPNKESHGK